MLVGVFIYNVQFFRIHCSFSRLLRCLDLIDLLKRVFSCRLLVFFWSCILFLWNNSFGLNSNVIFCVNEHFFISEDFFSTELVSREEICGVSSFCNHCFSRRVSSAKYFEKCLARSHPLIFC